MVVALFGGCAAMASHDDTSVFLHYLFWRHQEMRQRGQFILAHSSLPLGVGPTPMGIKASLTPPTQPAASVEVCEALVPPSSPLGSNASLPTLRSAVERREPFNRQGSIFTIEQEYIPPGTGNCRGLIRVTMLMKTLHFDPKPRVSPRPPPSM